MHIAINYHDVVMEIPIIQYDELIGVDILKQLKATVNGTTEQLATPRIIIPNDLQIRRKQHKF